MIAFARYLKRSIRHMLIPPPIEEMQEWSIGIYVGETPWRISSAGPMNPVLTRHDVSDADAGFVADPFMLQVDGTWHMFFEVMNWETGKGEIGSATSPDGFTWEYRKIVLSEPFHLSYPYVFKWENEYYMIPESWQAGAVRLYRAAHFPTQWTPVATLLEGEYLADSSIFRKDDYWWMFVENGENFRCDTLRLYFAASLTGPWVEHPKSPIVRGNAHIARPAGRVLVNGSKIIRFAQDCSPKYGLQVFAMEVKELTLDSYSERALLPDATLKGTSSGWSSHGMHHVDAHHLDDGRWIACVDGWRGREVEKR